MIVFKLLHLNYKTTSMKSTFFFYDYETTGIDPKRDRVIQFAGIRTDENFNLIDEPIAKYSKLSYEVVPSPEALLITGINYETLEEKGVTELDLTRLIFKEFSTPYTCVVGYNNIRFDDEFTRYSFYRNFYDPYAREWQNNNSRWDLIDLVRICAALRPQGVNWPLNDTGTISFKLENLTKSNNLQHNKAHDALSDVYATIEIAKLIKNVQPKLLNYLLNCRKKSFINGLINLDFKLNIDIHTRLVVHSSRMISSEFCATSIFLPLIRNPINQNDILAWDLRYDPSPLFSLQNIEQVKYLLYTAQDQLQAGETRLALKNIFVNKSPAIAPFNTVDHDSFQRIKLDKDLVLSRATRIVENLGSWFELISQLFYITSDFNNNDVEHQLYDGFISKNDRALCNKVHTMPNHKLIELQDLFTDIRLKELLFRYRARNFPDTLTHEEQMAWHDYCIGRLDNINNIAGISRNEFIDKASALLAINEQPESDKILRSWLNFYQHNQNSLC
jgi:exodeoxyribonuclease-1